MFRWIRVAVASASVVASVSSLAAGPSEDAAEFGTDFTRHLVPYSEILSGGPPKDGIPAIDEPRFVSVVEADVWLKPREPVVAVSFGPTARAYPLQILMFHELVNDRINDEPVTISFCPLCNTAIVFKGRLGGRDLTFGTTGRLRYSNLVMYDRQTETWWQQATGEAIVGELLGERLETAASSIISWEAFRSAYPTGEVLSRETGHGRTYGRNPYVGYDDVDATPFLFRGRDLDGRLSPMARVVTVDTDSEAVAFPYDILERDRVVQDTVGGRPIVVFWQQGSASALDAPLVADGRDVGMVQTFSRTVGDQELTFHAGPDGFSDLDTKSTWSFHGVALSGPLKGTALTPVVHINHFWFSWAAFRPETRIYGP